MMTCILVAGTIFMSEGNRSYNLHHATWMSFNEHRGTLTADFGVIKEYFKVPPGWAANTVEDVLRACVGQAEIDANRG
jgi:hypothetical protein